MGVFLFNIIINERFALQFKISPLIMEEKGAKIRWSQMLPLTVLLAINWFAMSFI